MSSTLLDLQRMNLKKMEATEAAPTADSKMPSNEVSIIPSITPSHHQSNDAVKEAVKAPSIERGITPSSEPMGEASDEVAIIAAVAKPPPRKPAVSRTAKADLKEMPKDPLREALDEKLRVHLMEQLMPLNGKGPVTRLNVEMPEDLHQQLKQHCVKSRTPIKALINALIALYLEAEGEA
jgi:hypothetical protein